MFSKLLREPLIHFLVLGGFIFLFYSFSGSSIENEENNILISQTQIKQMKFIWEKKHFREPTQDEIEQLIEQKIYEKVMVKEALKIGLSENDHIINRRLMQKMEFISSDIVEVKEASEKELRSYLTKHSEEFMSEGKISFKQLYFKEHQKAKVFKNYQNYSGSFMIETIQENLTNTDVQRKFGKEFTKQLFSLQTGQWSEPIRSAYGYHLLFIISKEEKKLREFQTIKPLLKQAYLDEERLKKNREFYENLQAQYTITIEQ